eukprot:gene2588-3549_t
MGQSVTSVSGSVIGQTINIKGYKLISVLGEGGFGTVYRAISQKNGQYYAIKVMEAPNMDEITTISSEISIMKKLEHPNLVKIEQTFFQVVNKNLLKIYIVMELCDCSLDLFLSIQESPIPNYLVLKWFVELLSALSMVHSKNIVHSDIKPGNIMLKKEIDGDLCLKIGDFGAGIHLGDEGVSATPLYIPPELLMTQKFEKSMDIWALGLCLFQVLANLSSEKLFQIFLQIKGEGLVFFNSVSRKSVFDQFNIDPLFQKILEKMLCAPKDRMEAADLLQLTIEVISNLPKK